MMPKKKIKITKRIFVYVIGLLLVVSSVVTSYAWFDGQISIGTLSPVQAGIVKASYTAAIDAGYYGEPDIIPVGTDNDGDAIPVTVTITNYSNIPIVYELDLSSVINSATTPVILQVSNGTYNKAPYQGTYPVGYITDVDTTSLTGGAILNSNKLYGVIQPTVTTTTITFKLHITYYATTYPMSVTPPVLSNNITQAGTFIIDTSGMMLRYCQATQTAVDDVFQNNAPTFTPALPN